jgi:hypothetical protein
MAGETISEREAEQVLDEILERLRTLAFEELATEIAETANTRVVQEIDKRELEHLPRGIRSELSTKSVRSRTSIEKLEVALEILDSRLREAPAVAAAAARQLGVAPEDVWFAPDDTALEGVADQRRDERFSLRELRPTDDDRTATVRLLGVLWSAVGKSLPEKEKDSADS